MGREKGLTHLPGTINQVVLVVRVPHVREIRKRVRSLLKGILARASFGSAVCARLVGPVVHSHHSNATKFNTPALESLIDL